MKLINFGSIGIIVALTVGFDFGFIGKALAANQYCDGASCNDKDPVKYNCNSDARVVTQLRKTVYRWQDSWQARKIIVQKIYSEKCHATWTKAYIPDDTYLFIRERDLVKGSQPIHGMFKADGKGYFWAYGKMSNGYVANQACAAIPSINIPRIGYTYERHCTGFN
jgi:hypothetical protein